MGIFQIWFRLVGQGNEAGLQDYLIGSNRKWHIHLVDMYMKYSVHGTCHNYLCSFKMTCKNSTWLPPGNLDKLASEASNRFQKIGLWGPELIWQMVTKYKMSRKKWPDKYVCVFVYVKKYACVSVYVCMCAYVYLCACVCICMCWCLCRCMCMSLCIYACVYLWYAKYKICIFSIHAYHKKFKMWKWYYISIHVCLYVSICLCVSVLCVWCAKCKISIFGMNVT